MTDNSDQQDIGSQHKLDDDVFDRQLDTALAKFAMVEPRGGLEERILANLRIEQNHAAQRSWWRWPTVAALAAVIVVSLSAAWRSRKPAQDIAGQHPPATTTDQRRGTHVANNIGGVPIRPRAVTPEMRLNLHAVSRPAAIASAPRLEQFPSPEPLSEQETILTRYVTNYPEHAALIAQARSEELRRDSAEEMGEAAAASGQNSQQQNK